QNGVFEIRSLIIESIVSLTIVLRIDSQFYLDLINKRGWEDLYNALYSNAQKLWKPKLQRPDEWNSGFAILENDKEINSEVEKNGHLMVK
ncbi:15749_t:CDS:2, partial [Racocetra persica]